MTTYWGAVQWSDLKLEDTEECWTSYGWKQNSFCARNKDNFICNFEETMKSENNLIKYFAYGSNMLTARLINRVPSAKFVSTGYLTGRRLTFCKVSKDGSGKCDGENTQRESDRVYGVVFEFDKSDEWDLNKAEGLNKGYKKINVNVVTTSGTIQAMTYVATNINNNLKPYRWYKAITLAGAVENRLPTSYVEWLRAVEAVEDPESERRAKNEKIIFENQEHGA